MSGPLDGVRVVELGVWVAGPGAGGILADWGADVVKIEPPEGDPCRTFLNVLGGDLPSNPVFELDNRGKRAIALDLSSERGLDLAHQLVAGADVFLTNLRPAALERIGLGPDQVHERHPGLVYAIITGYGLEGPDANGVPTMSRPFGREPGSPRRYVRRVARCPFSEAAWATTRQR